MPLKFEEPEAREKVAKPASKPKPAAKSSSGSGKTGGRALHRRVHTNSSYYFAKVKITVVEASDLNGKKGIHPFCKVYLGSKTFTTATQKKNGLSPTWGDTFEESVDRDDTIQFKVYDHKKLARNLDVQRDIPPLGKKKLTVKTIARKDVQLDEWYNLVGGGRLHVLIDIQINTPKPGAVHTKFFSYPTWMNDKYGVNVQEADTEAICLGLSTLTRYAIRWVRNQRGIVGLLNDDEEEEEDAAAADAGADCEALENLEFQVADISICFHNKCLQLIVAYHWVEKEPKVEDIDDEFGIANVLNVKIFTKPGPWVKKKKQIHSYKPMLPELFTKEFKLLAAVTEEVTEEAVAFLNDESNDYRLMKLLNVTTNISHHAVVFYYR
eukprot:CAMPEP_0114625096 /NCGR_PEP_ID=MMETSP0168-20121206/11098_1 /TAXON_ID=95228 ORGANISM="Vannella sp., Strain DIVA3 517/6/12" /NCGR_SAMPLE_ID=MMETSP0168 /ASSEMBLY_ACC=CAM_ASM_000044 /LENGTH=380 /DNA_ID=CAMNT_0001836375 /DNA_START=53 /DNA_END=1195 /DNA_ORIENTATION=-